MNEIIPYISQKSDTETLGEFEIMSLVMYHTGAARYQKKYNQNHFFISFLLNDSSVNSSISFPSIFT